MHLSAAMSTPYREIDVEIRINEQLLTAEQKSAFVNAIERQTLMSVGDVIVCHRGMYQFRPGKKDPYNIQYICEMLEVLNLCGIEVESYDGAHLITELASKKGEPEIAGKTTKAKHSIVIGQTILSAQQVYYIDRILLCEISTLCALYFLKPGTKNKEVFTDPGFLEPAVIVTGLALQRILKMFVDDSANLGTNIRQMFDWFQNKTSGTGRNTFKIELSVSEHIDESELKLILQKGLQYRRAELFEIGIKKVKH